MWFGKGERGWVKGGNMGMAMGGKRDKGWKEEVRQGLRVGRGGS